MDPKVKELLESIRLRAERIIRQTDGGVSLYGLAVIAATAQSIVQDLERLNAVG